MPEKLMRWDGSAWVEVSLVRAGAVPGGGATDCLAVLKTIDLPVIDKKNIGFRLAFVVPEEVG